MHHVVIAVGIIVGLAVVGAIGYLIYRGGTSEISTEFRPRQFLSASEASLYRVIVQAVSGRLVVFPKVRLLDIVTPVEDSDEAIENFLDKDVDFVLVEPLSLRVIAVIEIYEMENDEEEAPDDPLIEAALQSAGIHLACIPRSKSYSLVNVKQILGSALPGMHQAADATRSPDQEFAMIFRPFTKNDSEALSKLDTSSTADRIYRPVRNDFAFTLKLEEINPPLLIRYDIHPDDPAECQMWDYAVIAEENGAIAGFAAAQNVAWNRRVAIWHFYVTPEFRRKGVGAQLLAKIDDYARTVSARCLWLETQNTNFSAIQFYLRSGFSFCGFDETLYDPSEIDHPATALFFSRSI